MIGSISKVRPCGHSHVYKYAHAKKYADMQRVSVNFKEDSDGHGNWEYFMTNVQDLGSIFSGTLPNLTNLDVVLPNCTTASWGASHVTGIIDWKLDMPKATYTHAMMYGYSSTRNNVTLILPEATNISAMNAGNGIRGDYNLYAPKALICGALLEWGGTSNVDKLNLYMPSATDITNITYGGVPYLKYDIDEDGNCTTISGKPKVESVFMTFKNLEKGSMQLSQLNKEYSTAFLNDLPDWTGNTTTHSLTLGIHFDLKYDPELQTELLKVGNNYTPTINVSGGPTTNKNWNLKVNWNGTSNGYATPKEEIVVSNDYELPQNYTKLKYLDSTSTASSGYGRAYIKTGIIPTSQTGFYVEAMVANNNGYVFGCHNSDGNGMGIDLNNWSANGLQDSPPGLFYGTRSFVTNTTNFPIHNIFSVMHMNYKNNKYAFLKMGDAQWHKDLGEFNYDISSQVFLFGLCTGSGGLSEGLRGKIYRAQITEGEEVVRDFVPCLDADGVPCMRDLINDVDYYNEGSGQFTYELA